MSNIDLYFNQSEHNHIYFYNLDHDKVIKYSFQEFRTLAKKASIILNKYKVKILFFFLKIIHLLI